MNYRAAMIGASLEILSENGRGTSVICTYTENGESPD
jgi:signal transduction histidine kinase